MKLSSQARTTHTKERDRADIRKYKGKEKRQNKCEKDRDFLEEQSIFVLEKNPCNTIQDIK